METGFHSIKEYMVEASKLPELVLETLQGVYKEMGRSLLTCAQPLGLLTDRLYDECQRLSLTPNIQGLQSRIGQIEVLKDRISFLVESGLLLEQLRYPQAVIRHPSYQPVQSICQASVNETIAHLAAACAVAFHPLPQLDRAFVHCVPKEIVHLLQVSMLEPLLSAGQRGPVEVALTVEALGPQTISLKVKSSTPVIQDEALTREFDVHRMTARAMAQAHGPGWDIIQNGHVDGNVLTLRFPVTHEYTLG
ncbi:MAG: hypothetical protein PHS44_00040 [Candidatus Dojkabacteria bacterium]|nr:hypothetical protein [Candidatus Dojkabacteria bacterium]